MSWVQVSSDSIALAPHVGTYGIAKYPIRQSFALVHHAPGVTEVAAYFKSEEHAMRFAEAFRLTVKDYRSGEPTP